MWRETWCSSFHHVYRLIVFVSAPLPQNDAEEPDDLKEAKKNTMMNEDIEEKQKSKEETRVRNGNTCGYDATNYDRMLFSFFPQQLITSSMSFVYYVRNENWIVWPPSRQWRSEHDCAWLLGPSLQYRGSLSWCPYHQGTKASCAWSFQAENWLGSVATHIESVEFFTYWNMFFLFNRALRIGYVLEGKKNVWITNSNCTWVLKKQPALWHARSHGIYHCMTDIVWCMFWVHWSGRLWTY